MTEERRHQIEQDLMEGLRTKKLQAELREYIEGNRRRNLEMLAFEHPGIGNQKTMLTKWIIENMNSDYQLLKTQREITSECSAEGNEVSINAVMRTLQALCSGDEPFMEMPMQGVYQIREEVLKGCD